MARHTLIAAAALAMLTAAPCSAQQARPEWLISWAKARERAAKENKLILANFTGSDWCRWCIKLKDEVFNTPRFAEWAAQNVVLLELDFPHRRRLPSALAAQNRMLANKYGITGYPTVLFLDAEGNKVGRSGYSPGGPEPWLRKADSILADRPAQPRVQPLTSAAEALSQAAASGQPVLLVATNDRTNKAAETMFNNPDFARYAAVRLVVLHVRTDRKMSDADTQALAPLADKLPLSELGPRVAVIDSEGKNVLAARIEWVSPTSLMANLERVLPPIPYDGRWLDDLDTALQIAASRKRPVLVDFTGSDWCGWCIRLDKEIFATDAFKAYAREKLVLVKIDFPRSTPQPPEVKRKNEALSEKYNVEGFPTIIVLDPTGKRIGELGYMAGGPNPFLAKLRAIVK